jgi:hypothetical protein
MGFDFTAGRACTAASGRTKAPAGHRDNCSRREPEVIAAATETPHTGEDLAPRLQASLLGHQLGHKLPVTKRLRITSKFLVLLAEGEVLETNLLRGKSE